MNGHYFKVKSRLRQCVLRLGLQTKWYTDSSEHILIRIQRRLDTHQLDELRETEAQLDQHRVSVVGHGPNESIVCAEQVIVQSFGVRVRTGQWH